VEEALTLPDVVVAGVEAPEPLVLEMALVPSQIAALLVVLPLAVAVQQTVEQAAVAVQFLASNTTVVVAAAQAVMVLPSLPTRLRKEKV
jgi:hypothetical protein